MNKISLAISFFICVFLSSLSFLHAQSNSHPHLFFGQAGVNALRDRANQDPVLSKMWQKFRKDRVGQALKIDVLSTFDQDTGREYGDALADLAIAFIITRDTRYVAKAREIATALANTPDWGQQLAIAHISIGFAFAWDFMYDHFSDGERNDIRNAIRNNADNIINANPLSNHNWTPSAAEGLVGLAFRDDGSSSFNKFVRDLLNGARNNFKEGAGSVLWAHGADGFSPQGPGYWRKYNHVALFLKALRHNDAEDWFHLGKEYPGSEFLEKNAYPRIYTDVQSLDIGCISWGDSQQIGTDNKGPYSCMGMLALAASEYKDGAVMDFLKTLVNESRYRFEDEDAAAFIFYDPAGVPNKSYRDLPLSGYWPNMEGAVFRSGWDKNDIVFFLRSGSPGGHARRIKSLPKDGHSHPDANGFVLFYNSDYLAAEDGAKPDFGPDAGLRITYGHNTLLVDGKGQKGDLGTRVGTTSANMDFLDAEHVGYLLGDASSAYENLNQFYRYVIYKKHKYFIIVDEIKDESRHRYDFLLGTDKHHFITSSSDNKFYIKPQEGSAKLPVVFVEPRNLSSSIDRDRPYAYGDVMVDLLHVWPSQKSENATFFALLYPRKNGESDPSFSKIYDGDRSGIKVDGNEYHLYNKNGARYSYGNITTDAKLCYYKDDANAFEYLAAGAEEFLYKGNYGISSTKPLVAAFKGRMGKVRLGKNLGTSGEATVTFFYPGITGVLIDGQPKSLVDSSPGSVTCRLSPKQYKTGPSGYEQTVTDNYMVEFLTGGTQSFVQLTSPNGGETWQAGSSQSITWTSDGSFPNVRLEFSVDGGSIWSVVTNSTANDGNYNWSVPGDVSGNCLVRVSDASDGSPADVSDAVFAIVAVSAPVPEITSFTPASGPPGAAVSIFGSHFSGVNQVQFNGTSASFTSNSDDEITATVPSGATTGRISLASPAGTAVSANDFTVGSGGGGTLTTFNPVHDARVKLSAPNDNYGDRTTLKVEQGKFRSYLKFNIAGITGNVASAVLRMRVESASVDGGSVFAVSNDYSSDGTPWTEQGLTFKNAPEIGDAVLSSVGSVSVGEIVEFDVTAAVTGNGLHSFGIRSNSTDKAAYYSKEGDYVPQLVVETASGGGPVQYALSLSFQGEGSVNLNPVGGIYDDGTLVELTANAVPGWEFSGWAGDLSGAANPAIVAMDADKNVTAIFTQVGVQTTTLNLTIQGSGDVTLDPTGGVYEAGTEVQLTADPAAGWEFTNWSGDLSGASLSTVLTMDSDKDVTATFGVTENGGGGSFTFNPVADAYVKSSRQTSNYGDRDILRLRNGSPEYRSYLKFSVSGLSGQPTSAKLRLYVTDSSNDGGAVVSVSNSYGQTGAPWQEDGLTWSNAPAMSGTALSSVGSVGIDEWIEFDVTPAVLANGVISFGLVSKSSNSVKYSSKEGSRPPELVIRTGSGGSGNVAPVAVNDEATTVVGIAIVIQVTENDFDLDGNIVPASVDVVTLPQNGSASVNPHSGLITYIPDGGFAGVDRFEYTVADDSAAVSNRAEVVVTVTGGGGEAGTLVFLPTDDGQVKLTDPSRNYGGKSSAKVEKGKFNSYFKFSVSGIAGPVQQARLELYVVGDSNAGGSIYLVPNSFSDSGESWVEAALTAKNAPAIDGAALSSLGSVSADTFVEFDVTPAISGDGTYSFAIRSSSLDQVKFSTREDERPPELTVVFGGAALTAREDLLSLNEFVRFGENDSQPLPEEFRLSPNFPNPFNAETNIRYTLPEETHVRLQIFNIKGQLVRTLVNEIEQAGFKDVRWLGKDSSGLDVGSGMYFIQLEVKQQKFVERLLLQK